MAGQERLLRAVERNGAVSVRQAVSVEELPDAVMHRLHRQAVTPHCPFYLNLIGKCDCLMCRPHQYSKEFLSTVFPLSLALPQWTLLMSPLD